MSRDEVALNIEIIVDGGMDAEKALGGSGRFEPLHFALVAAPQAWGQVCRPLSPGIRDGLPLLTRSFRCH